MGDVVNLFEPKNTPEKALESALAQVRKDNGKWTGVMIMLLDARNEGFYTQLSGAGLLCTQGLAIAEITRDRMLLEMGYRK